MSRVLVARYFCRFLPREKTKTRSPDSVLMSVCRSRIFAPVISPTTLYKRGRALSIRVARIFLTKIFAVDRLCQLFFRGGQNAFETNDNQIFDDVGARFFRAAAHVIDLELDDGATNLGFDFAFCLHRTLPLIDDFDIPIGPLHSDLHPLDPFAVRSRSPLKMAPASCRDGG